MDVHVICATVSVPAFGRKRIEETGTNSEIKTGFGKLDQMNRKRIGRS
jgi:hypothetical protein